MEFSLMTSNIRFENKADGDNNWPNRKALWSKIVEENNISILCTQEGRNIQLLDAESQIDLDLIHDHREWIPERMYPCIFYKKSEYNILDSGDFWLSETPHLAGSKSFNSAFPRLCTWALLEKENNRFYVFNCHLDHILDETRHEQSKVLVKQINKLNQINLPIILAGDFNEPPDGLVRSHITNELSLIDPVSPGSDNDQGTHHKFDGNNLNTSRIDWILHDERFNTKSFKIIKKSDAGIYPSDHFPVMAIFNI